MGFGLHKVRIGLFEDPANLLSFVIFTLPRMPRRKLAFESKNPLKININLNGVILTGTMGFEPTVT